MALDAFERYPLLFGPSPIHPLDRLTAELGGARIWAKREDCNSGLAYGGNKTRKLEYLIPEALAQGADTLVTIGGVQSNHTRQVAAVAAKIGLKAVLLQESWVDWPDPVNDKVGNILLSRIMGAQVKLVDAEFGIGFKESWEQAIADVEEGGGTPYAIPAGASDHELGGLGFARWAEEVAEQERALGVFFDTVIVCSVTGSTQASPARAAAAATCRVWFDCTPPIDTRVSQPLASASATRYSSLRVLLPPNASPLLQSSRFAHSRAPPR